LCGDRIGVYEPIWLELRDGSLHRSSYLNLEDHPGYDPSRLWHLDCFIPTCANLAASAPRDSPATIQGSLPGH
jgi:hypothetical protein